MRGKIGQFWQRISDGLAIQQLWEQFHADARTSYQLYSKEVRSEAMEGESRWKHVWPTAQGLFWAMMMKLSPGRRVMLLTALVILLLPDMRITGREVNVDTSAFRFWAGAILFVLLALELADRVSMKRDLEIAREIQRWLMPSVPPEVPGFDIAFASRPANTVAGDYYDAFFRPNNCLLIIVADVVGKSVPAALLTATLQASLRTLAALPGSLAELVSRVNRYACDQNVGGHRFTTAFLAELEPSSGCMTYVNAGHNWPVLRRGSGIIERLQIGGLPLGISGGRSYESAMVNLGRGDLLLMFTDGIVEAENEQALEYGEERMLPLVQEMQNANAHEALTKLMSSVDWFVGSTRQHDDITCVAVRVC
ncbi:MAG: PP2C family protein-serine/threonine phosphatase [Acidobacteriia bacterium]|nr:PP2C family protein-serine/threonine phosphatase [Terriglobia bacterium]